MWGAESIPTKEPIRTLEEFDGVKMRSPEGIGAALWRKVGVGVSTLPGSEVYTALERGKIDATDWGTLGMNDELGYNKIAPYAIYPGIHSLGAADISMNMKTWESLPEDLQAIIELAVRELNRDSLMTNAMLDASFVAARDPETLINWSQEERKKLRNVAKDVWAEWAEKSPMSKKIYDSHVAFMTKLGLL
jgi:TRAP-type mannitol/chloroaromatic compound transport system substrate-binding protein